MCGASTTRPWKANSRFAAGRPWHPSATAPCSWSISTSSVRFALIIWRIPKTRRRRERKTVPDSRLDGWSEVRKCSFAGHEIYYGAGGAIIAPAVCVTDRELVITLSMSAMKAYLVRKDHRSLATLASVKAALNGPDRLAALCYCDTPRLFNVLYPVFSFYAGMGAHGSATEWRRIGPDVLAIRAVHTAASVSRHHHAQADAARPGDYLPLLPADGRRERAAIADRYDRRSQSRCQLLAPSGYRARLRQRGSPPATGENGSRTICRHKEIARDEDALRPLRGRCSHYPNSEPRMRSAIRG